MTIQDFFPIWNQLNADQQRRLQNSLSARKVKKGEILHNGDADCAGLLLVRSGQLRAFILSEEGREITIYRLFDRDICLFSASCIMRSVQFEVTVEAERDTEFFVIPADVYRRAMAESAPLANFTNALMAARFSDVMWLLEQLLWKSMDRRLAAFLLEEAAVEGTDTLRLTHERIAAHLGTAREVVTRLLRYFQGEGLVKLGRGSVELTDRRALAKLAA